MEDVVAVAVELDNGGQRYFLTWGRIQDPVDPAPLEDLIMAQSRHFSLGGKPVSARVCYSLKEAAESASAPYFFECLLAMQVDLANRGDDYSVWRAERAKNMDKGRDINYCGRPISTQ